MTLKAKLAALAACSFALVAHGEVRTFNFSGTVTEALPMAPSGAPVTGTFAYDTGADPYLEFEYPNAPMKEVAYLGVPMSFHMQVNGHTMSAEIVELHILDSRKGGDGDRLWISGARMTLDGTRFEEGLLVLQLGSQPPNMKAVRSTRPPSKIHVKPFDWNYGTAMVDGSSTGTILMFHIDRIRATKPEPEDDD